MTKTCTIEGCDKPHVAKGLCGMHYRRKRLTGDVGEAEARIDRPQRLCSMPGCEKPHAKNGFCSMHAARLERHGTTDKPVRRSPARDFIESVTDDSDECIPWPFHVDEKGYGTYTDRNGINGPAHRYICIKFHGDPEPGQVTRHKCKTKSCINPNHVEWGTYSENQMDRFRDGTACAGESNYNNKLTEADVLAIRERVANGEVQAHMAKEFGITPQRLNQIVKRKAWRHI